MLVGLIGRSGAEKRSRSCVSGLTDTFPAHDGSQGEQEDARVHDGTAAIDVFNVEFEFSVP